MIERYYSLYKESKYSNESARDSIKNAIDALWYEYPPDAIRNELQVMIEDEIAKNVKRYGNEEIL